MSALRTLRATWRGGQVCQGVQGRQFFSSWRSRRLRRRGRVVHSVVLCGNVGEFACNVHISPSLLCSLPSRTVHNSEGLDCLWIVRTKGLPHVGTTL